MSYNQPQLSFNDPGIGYLLVLSVIQFLFYNLILFLLETNLLSNMSCIKCTKKSNSIDDTSSIVKVSS